MATLSMRRQLSSNSTRPTRHLLLPNRAHIVRVGGIGRISRARIQVGIAIGIGARIRLALRRRALATPR